MNNIGLEVVFWTVLTIYLLTKLGVFKNETNSRDYRPDTGSNATHQKDGSINWSDDDEIGAQLAGTFANDRFIVIKNKTKDPVISAKPHPYYDYERMYLQKMVEKSI